MNAQDDTTRLELQDAEFELLMLHNDGELPVDRAGELATLLATSAAARAVLADLTVQRELVRAIAVDALGQPAVQRQDLSLMPGRVLRKLPTESATPGLPQVQTGESGLVAWVRGLGLGKVGFAVGAAAMAALALIVANGGVAGNGAEDGVSAPELGAEMAAVPGTNTAREAGEDGLIIEETEIDSGGLMVHPPHVQGGSTVIWHFSDDQKGPAPAAGGEG